MLIVKQGGIKYHFLSYWYDMTWDWTPVSQTIGEHSTKPHLYYVNVDISFSKWDTTARYVRWSNLRDLALNLEILHVFFYFRPY